jgi:hypothetical protein
VSPADIHQALRRIARREDDARFKEEFKFDRWKLGEAEQTGDPHAPSSEAKIPPETLHLTDKTISQALWAEVDVLRKYQGKPTLLDIIFRPTPERL